MKRKITLNEQFVKLKIRLRSIILERKIVTHSININNPTPWKKTKKIVTLSFFPPIVARK